MITAYHAKYFANALTRKNTANDVSRLSQSLFDASVDLNPHQIEAALFALKSPISKGALLADEVGLGKTIEAGIVLCQYWAERKRRLLVICPASLRKQWELELSEKFNLPAQVLDAKMWREHIKKGIMPLNQKSIIVISYNFANKIKEELRTIDWNLVVIDEAHKLRNAYRESNKIGQGIRFATRDSKKLLLTATPLQNSLVELYGLSTLIDEHIFGDLNSFRSQFTSSSGDLGELRERLATFTKRTLRKQVIEYIRYTERKAMTFPFNPTDEEQKLYETVSNFLLRKNSYAIPQAQRHLTELILRKLLASSSYAIAGTLAAMKFRLETLRDEKVKDDYEFTELLINSEELEDELLDDILEQEPSEQIDNTPAIIDYQRLKEEIAELSALLAMANNIAVDTKSKSLTKALEIGFQEIEKIGGKRKALIFTESRRTQSYLKEFLEEQGYQNQVLEFNGSNNSKESTAIYENWLANNQNSSRVTGSRDIDIRTALIEHFRDTATIMIATEAAAEGVNIQFCSLVINYDLPWNPQRVEQRIGRCHRYGQKHDVVVINFLNERNQADKRVLEILTDKFKLFSGVFGASDDVLGSIESGVDFEKRILSIYQDCRTPEEIDSAFQRLRDELEKQIKNRISDTQKMLLENFDEDVHERLKVQLQDAKMQLDRFSKRFWQLSKYILSKNASFNDNQLSFNLEITPTAEAKTGAYYLISKSKPASAINENADNQQRFLYRLSHPLGEFVTQSGKNLTTPLQHLIFNITEHELKLSQVEELKGKKGYLSLSALCIESFDQEEYLLFSAFDQNGKMLDQETCEKLFYCDAEVKTTSIIDQANLERLKAEAERHIKATISLSLEENSKHFNEAREKLERWADDLILASEKALKDTKDEIKALQRQARIATNLDEQYQIQQRIQKLERQLRKQRQEIFDVEDQIIEKRDELISSLEKRMSQSTKTEELFTITWEVV